MKSERPKPLHRLCGKPMIMYVLDALATCGAETIAVVVGHKADWVTKKIGEASIDLHLEFVEQSVQRGTGDAAIIGLTGLPDDPDEGDVLVLPGDAPLLRAETIAELVRVHRSTDVAATVLTALMDDPTGYGRVVRGKDGHVSGIVEEGDATDAEREISEINTSIYCFKRSLHSPALRRLDPDNAQGEYYLTDVIGVLASAGHTVDSVVAPSAVEVGGVNDRVQLSQAEAELRRRTTEQMLRSGVTLVDPANTYLDATVSVGRDVTLFPGVILQGNTTVGDGSEIGPNTRLVDCTVGSGCVIEETTARTATIGDGAVVGPFAVLHPGCEIPADHRTGPFYNSSATDG
jgi:bifunctional UDP-N-acetylglucosamine pyrophosphorylase/glucosamine-1-phosphate N-acetyltransferase